MKFITNSSDETFRLGKKIGECLEGGEFIALSGDLGGGKTQFTKGLACGLGVDEIVISPTFTIEQIYKCKSDLELHHFDLYRIRNDSEIEAAILDLRNETKNVVVVEWPENIGKLESRLENVICFKYLDENIREIEITNEKWAEKCI